MAEKRTRRRFTAEFKAEADAAGNEPVHLRERDPRLRQQAAVLLGQDCQEFRVRAGG